MTSVMKGMRVIEVAEHAFVPVAGALLSDWGAEVIKVEPAARGDAARGLIEPGKSGVQVRFQNSNRGKKSIGLDLTNPEAREVLYKLVETADVFLTNKLPSVRKRLGIDVDQIRARNPRIVYLRGSGQGARGEESDKGAYDLLTYWHRSGASSAVASPRGEIPFLPSPGFGDYTGAMFIAGGVMGALLHRERTGEAPIVDVSLLSTGMWSMGGSGAIAATDGEHVWPPATMNPLSWIYRTKDDRYVALSCLQAGYYWPLLCDVVGRPDLREDPRFADHASIMANSAAGRELLGETFAQDTLDNWRERLASFEGQWAVVQDVLQAVNDPQALANGYVQDGQTADGIPYKVVAAPVQYDGVPAKPQRAPDFNEHCDEVLAQIGIVGDAVIDLKISGAVA